MNFIAYLLAFLFALAVLAPSIILAIIIATH